MAIMLHFDSHDQCIRDEYRCLYFKDAETEAHSHEIIFSGHIEKKTLAAGKTDVKTP